jgi:hypothetical protein
LLDVCSFTSRSWSSSASTSSRASITCRQQGAAATAAADRARRLQPCCRHYHSLPPLCVRLAQTHSAACGQQLVAETAAPPPCVLRRAVGYRRAVPCESRNKAPAVLPAFHQYPCLRAPSPPSEAQGQQWSPPSARPHSRQTAAAAQADKYMQQQRQQQCQSFSALRKDTACGRPVC